ncbi:MAG: type 2 lanthipeptide synthetase LanM [Propionibacteriaceae bacterium]|nr:type 2 lanthipeptide synthetase LanM [Propionibacteriaceae bacterium]
MQPTVYAAFPELDSTEVDALLTRNRAHEVLAELNSRLVETNPITNCPLALLQRVSDLLPETETPEPFPFFEATLSLIHEEMALLLDSITQHDLLANPHRVQRSVTAAVIAQVEQIVLRAQIRFASEHQLPKDQITCRRSEYSRLSTLLATKRGLRLFQEGYPIAVNIARCVVQRRTDFIQQLLDQLKFDLPSLHELGIPRDARVVDISLGQGDSHHGKSVTVLTFSNESRLVYKPRPLANDRAFETFQKHLNTLTNNPKLRACKVIDRGDYGWAEYVTDDQDSRFTDPAALGAFAAAVQLLGISDVHFENVRFKNGIPILTDTETLFSSLLESRQNPLNPASRTLARLVTTSGFFPSPLIVPHRRNPMFVDVGVLGQRSPGGSSERVLTLHDPFTSDMRIKHEVLADAPSEAPPSVRVSGKFVDAVCESFRATLAAALADVPTLVQFIRRTFADCWVRSVAADTVRYTKVLELATNAACLSDPELLLAALSRVGVFRGDVPAALLASELKQLAQWDTPTFVVAATGTDLISDHQVVLPEAMTASPLDSAVAALQSIDDEFIRLSEWMIRVSFAPYYGEDQEGTGFEFNPTSDDTRPLAPPAGHRWQDLSLGHLRAEGEFAPTWLGARLSNTAHQYWYPHELSLDAYAGSSGVALATAACPGGSIDMADEYFHGLMSKLGDGAVLDPRLTRGPLAGIESALWAADCHAQQVHNEWLALRSRQLLRSLCETPSEGEDVVGGDAGLALILTHFAMNPVGDDAAESLNSLTAITTRLAGCLLGQQKPTNLTGYAHGQAGIAAALALAAPLVRSPIVDWAAAEALSRLLAARQPETGLWTIGTEHDLHGRGWCSGTPGVLLALAQIHSTGRFDDHKLEPIISFLVKVTKNDCFGGNTSLCHGDVGNLWVLREVAALMDNDPLAAEVAKESRRYVRDVLPRELTKPTRTAISHSLMCGTAGAALFEASLDDSHPTVRCPLWLA